jgi:hypothetical protein
MGQGVNHERLCLFVVRSVTGCKIALARLVSKLRRAFLVEPHFVDRSWSRGWCCVGLYFALRIAWFCIVGNYENGRFSLRGTGQVLSFHPVESVLFCSLVFWGFPTSLANRLKE